MAKGYWIARVDVQNEDGYKLYVAANGPVFKKFGAKFIVRGGKCEVPEGNARARNVVIEFSSLQAARDCYESPEYQAAKAIRQTCADGEIVIVEGFDG